MRGPLSRFAAKLLSTIPTTAPLANGKAMVQFNWFANAALVTPVIEISVKTPSEMRHWLASVGRETVDSPIVPATATAYRPIGPALTGLL